MLTGDKYDLFRPVCNRPEKKKTDRRGVWGLGAEGLWGVMGGFLLQKAEALVEVVCTAVSPAISRLAHPTFPHPHTSIHLQPASLHLPYLSFSLSHFTSHLFQSLSGLSLSSSAQERLRGQEPSGSLEQQGE